MFILKKKQVSNDQLLYVTKKYCLTLMQDILFSIRLFFQNII